MLEATLPRKHGRRGRAASNGTQRRYRALRSPRSTDLGARIRRRASVRWRQIVEQLDPGSGLGAQAGDTHMRVRNGGEPFLLGAGAGDVQTQAAAIKGRARLGVLRDDGTVVDAEVKLVLLLPARLAFAGWELDQLERVAVGIAERNRSDAARVRVRGGQCLRPGGNRRRTLPPHDRISPVDVRDDDREVLKPAAVAARMVRDRAGGTLHELDDFFAELQRNCRRFGVIARHEGERTVVEPIGRSRFATGTTIPSTA
jgi:hypothetical protein